MLLSPNRKKIATIIVGKLKKPDYVQAMGESSKTGDYKVPEPESEDEGSMALEAAMDEFKSALNAGDAKAMVRALKSFVYMCGEEGGESEAE